MFKARMHLGDGTWARARGWALWKTLITLQEGRGAADAARVRFGWGWPVTEVIDQLLKGEP